MSRAKTILIFMYQERSMADVYICRSTQPRKESRAPVVAPNALETYPFSKMRVEQSNQRPVVHPHRLNSAVRPYVNHQINPILPHLRLPNTYLL